MRWSIIRLIWLRDLRDQLRDRRTLFMIVVLPLLLYPILGFAVIQFALGFSDKPSTIGIVKDSNQRLNFPPRTPPTAGTSLAPHLAWLAATPASGVPGLPASAALASAGHLKLDYLYLVRDGRFTTFDGRFPLEHAGLLIAHAKVKIRWLDRFDVDLLNERVVDLILTAPGDFYARLETAEDELHFDAPAVQMHFLPDSEHGKQAKSRLWPLLESWKKDLKKVRLARKNLPAGFDEPFLVQESQSPNPASQARGIFELMIRVFPFMLVMWSLAGALYPAVDLCAGEKERGTMETLLITPAGREEIVVGKFLTIWIFSAASAVLNLLSMGITTWQFGSQILQGPLPVGALFWCVLLALPLSALFSAVSLAIGAYARSSKEGQYYLMPLFLITMPLIFLTLAPGVELNPFYSLVPVTGVALLMQRLMTATSLAQVPWLYFIPVLLPVALYSWLALKWAIMQFHREDVLFREAERLDFKLWLQRLFREKGPTPTTGQAFFCFALILFLRWMSMGFGAHHDLTVYTGVTLIAFVAAPALLMAVLLNTRPRDALYLRLPQLKEIGLAALLAILLLPPLVALAVGVFDQFPHLENMLKERQPWMQELFTVYEGLAPTGSYWNFLIALAVLPAICEEIAFRGFILNGLLKRFRPRTAIVLCAFLFALSHMNVFQFLPSFFLGVILGLLTVRSKSLLPAIMFHLLHNGVLLSGIHLASWIEELVPAFVVELMPVITSVCLVTALALIWWLYRKPYVDLERQLALEEEELQAQRAELP